MSKRIVFALTTVFACSEGGNWDWERMREQARLDTYEQPNIGPAPYGTVTHGFAAVVDSVVRYDLEAQELIERGASRYNIYCAVCHGEAGYAGSVVAANFYPVRPPSLQTAAMRALTPAHVFRVISDGIGRMPSYRMEMTPLDRWAAVAYLRKLQSGEIIPAASALDSTSGERFRARDSARVRRARTDSIARAAAGARR